jgi:hypothetical protein
LNRKEGNRRQYKKIPILAADFETLRRGNYICADKTKLLNRLVGDVTPYFLSRPRRFGKSSMMSSLEDILTGGSFSENCGKKTGGGGHGSHKNQIVL